MSRLTANTHGLCLLVSKLASDQKRFVTFIVDAKRGEMASATEYSVEDQAEDKGKTRLAEEEDKEKKRLAEEQERCRIAKANAHAVH